ncbi:MAG TPA: hypothetical protein VIU33_06490, partial [Nitrospiria bacterium]
MFKLIYALEPLGIAAGSPEPTSLFGALSFLVIPMAAIWSKKPAPSGEKDKSLSGTASARKAARELRKKGEFLRAAELFERGGEVELAAAMFREGKKPLLLGELYKRHEKWRDAANAFMEAKETEKAARMYELDRDFRKAASLYHGLKQPARSAEMYRKAYDFETAATIYQQIGNWDEAAKTYVEAGEPLKAAELYETAYVKEKADLEKKKKIRGGIQKKELSGLQKGAVNKLALEGARIYKAHNQSAKAAELFMAIDRKEEAAEAYEKAGNLAKAAELFTNLRRHTKAAQLYRKLGDPRRAAEITAAKHIESKNYSAAAEIFAEANDHLRAGEFYQRAGLPDLAAQMFIQGGDVQRAGRMMRSAGNGVVAAAMFEQAGSYKDAAELHQQAGNDDRALELWVKAGHFFEAGLLSHKLGRPEEAIEHLQKLGPQSKNYLDASILLGKIFLEGGMQDAARERFKTITSQNPLSVKTIEAYYRFATILEGDGKPREAVDLYEKILAQDYNYSDVRRRAADIKANLTDRSGPKPDPESKGRYRILKEIGRGGMGVVFLAEDTLLGRKVAYKELPQALKNDPNMLENILEEARMVAALNHPNIVT